MNAFSVLFVALVAAQVAVQSWLARRHLRHIQGHRAAVPAAFASDIALAEHQKAADYTAAKTGFGMIENGVAALVLLAWTLGGGIEALDSAWRAAAWPPLVTGTAVIMSVLLISELIELPLQYYRTFSIEERFGFNRAGTGLFLADAAKQTLLLVLIAAPLVLVVLWVMRHTGPIWWLWAWAVWAGFTLLMTWAYPTLIAPLFNRFEPLADGALRQRIHDLLERTGFTSRGVYVMDGSRRSGHSNAYFTGYGRNKRIVFFDTLMKTLEDEELEAVLAHELGHFKLHHVVKRMVLILAASLVALALLGWLAEQPWFYAGLGVSRPSDHAALILFMLAASPFLFFIRPLLAWRSRRHEFDADAFAAKHTAAGALVTALVKLYRENAASLTPDPLYSRFHDSHPPAISRIAELRGRA